IDDGITAGRAASQSRVTARSQRDSIRAADAFTAQAMGCFCDDVGILLVTRWNCERTLRARGKNPFDAGSGIALEDRAIFRDCCSACSVTQRIEVGIVRSTSDGVDFLARQLERNAHLDQRLRESAAGHHAFLQELRKLLRTTGGYGGSLPAERPSEVDHSTS